MDILIGKISPIEASEKIESRLQKMEKENMIEAKMLNIRPPRKRQSRPPKGEERRNDRGYQDPGNSRVMVLLIPEGNKIPKEIESGKYRVFLRFAKGKKDALDSVLSNSKSSHSDNNLMIIA
ncbi:MAG: hypothetical protein HQK73_06185 [Desulfamplus sp.]|nr:hypothetical protein [Desulfamplus sp.]MBF0411336.1 hypothetical protein [Desulfamplus sp.]